jgi:hypothetical protein
MGRAWGSSSTRTKKDSFLGLDQPAKEPPAAAAEEPPAAAAKESPAATTEKHTERPECNVGDRRNNPGHHVAVRHIQDNKDNDDVDPPRIVVVVPAEHRRAEQVAAR